MLRRAELLSEQIQRVLRQSQARLKKYAKQPVIMKLSPNVTSIAEIARAAEAGGADAVSLINTITGMKIDINRRSFVLANKTGGMSGPAVHPVAVRMVYETAHAVNYSDYRNGRYHKCCRCYRDDSCPELRLFQSAQQTL